MYLKVSNFIFAVFLTILWVVPNVYASGSGGIRMELPDSEASGKGSAFVGEADNPSAIYYNPAGLTQLKGKNYVSSGFSVLAPSVKHTDFAGNESQMVRQNFLIPHLYLVSDFGIDRWVFGLGGTSNWGSATDWADDSFSRYVATQSDVITMDTMVTAAYQANDQWSFAFGLNSTYSTVNKSKKLLQTGGADGDFSLKGKDTAWGYRLATHFKLTEEHRFGLMYRSPVELIYDGKIFLHELNTSGSNYFTIFGGTDFETAAQAKLKLPQSFVMGYSYQPEGKWLFNFDIEWMNWSSVQQDLVEYPDVTNATQLAILNAGNPAPLDWKDVWSASFGVEYEWNEDLRLRGGTYYHTTPIPEQHFNSNLPDANSYGITGGVGYDIKEDVTIDLAYEALFFEDFTIDTPSVGATINGEYEQIMHMGLATVTYDF